MSHVSNLSPLSSQSFSQSPSSQSLSSQYKLTEWLSNLKDPRTKKTLKKAVLLLPCGDSVNLSTAKKILKNPLCLICQAYVTGYVPNWSLRHVQGLIRHIQISPDTILPLLTQQLEKQPLPNQPFPGKGARFECTFPWGEWKGLLNGTLPILPICRKIAFESTTPHSFLTHVEIYGHQDDAISLSITCRDSYISDFHRYLSETETSNGVYHARWPHEIDRAFCVLAENNAFPKREFTFLRQLIEAKQWRSIPTTPTALLAPSFPLQEQVNTYLKSMEDPITLELLKDAVIFVPCGHSMSRISLSNITNLFNKARPCKCSLCKQPIRAYQQNRAIHFVEDLLYRIQASAVTILPTTTQQIPETPPPEPPFPIQGGRLVCSSVWKPWSLRSQRANQRNHDGALCRIMRFRSRSRNSWLTKVIVKGYQDNTISITIQCRNEVLTDYFSHLGFLVASHAGLKQFRARLPRALDWTLQFLKNYHELPHDKLAFLQQLVQARKWRSVEQSYEQSYDLDT